jgi:lipopolysaccharide export LptBFGC system permease protein LptF
MMDRGAEVVSGIASAGQPLAEFTARSIPRALLDVCVYYGIRALGMIFDLMPAMLLIAGVFAVTIMVRNNEHIILKSSGRPLQRAFMPLVALAAALSLGITALREFAMPTLILERDRLKPLVYHRSARPKSLSGAATDDQGRTVLYEIARYMHNLRTCEGLRMYVPALSSGGRLARLEADRAVFDPETACWKLQTRIREAGATPTTPPAHADYGILYLPEPLPGDPQDQPARFVCQHVASWKGQLTPAFLGSQDLGPSVMGLMELWQARDRPTYCSELWRRGSEWLTGALLLMVTIPLLVRQEVTSTLIGIGWCILYGAAYVGLILAATGAAREEVVCAWSPLLPHGAYLLLGVWRYGYRMET